MGQRPAVARVGVLALITIVLSVVTISDTFAQDPALYMDIADVSGAVGQLVEIPVYIQTLEDSLDGFQISLALSRPDLAYFEVDTVVIGEDTSYVCQFDTTGTLASGWEHVEVRSTLGTGLDLRLSGISDIGSGETPGIPDYTSGVLMRFYGRVMSDVPDTLTDRVVTLNINSCYYSNELGDLITPAQSDNGSITVLEGILGDCDCSGEVNPVDLVFLVNFVYKGWTLGCVLELGDVNCDGTINPVDVVFLINLVYKGWPLPC